MWTMWDAPSDRDYYGESGLYGGEPEPEEEPNQETEPELPDGEPGEQQ